MPQKGFFNNPTKNCNNRDVSPVEQKLLKVLMSVMLLLLKKPQYNHIFAKITHS
jgi:hypothetical protein